MQKLICGIDEAGRGPLAGPVTAAAVVLPEDFPFDILDDSKKLSEKKRIEIEKIIRQKALCFAVCRVEHTTIDSINILQASLLAMKNAFLSMNLPAGESINSIVKEVIIDGTFIPDFGIPGLSCTALPKADSLVPSVMAASILAKNERDRIMCSYAEIYPEYGYEKHKGYPTASHRAVCKKIGPSPIQRRTFRY